MIQTNPDFYLASTEGYGMEEPRSCWRIHRVSTPSRNDLLLIKISPPLPGQKYGLGGVDLETVLVATRHEGASLFPVNEWPLYVHVARALVENVAERDSLSEDEFVSIGWAELYPSEETARAKAI